MTIISKRINELREMHNLNKTEFGHKIGVNRSTITRYENGDLKPNVDVLISINKTFGVSIDWLAGVDDETIVNAYTKVIVDASKNNISPEKLQMAVDLMKG